MTHTPGPWKATSDWVISVRKDQRTTTVVANCKLSERRHKEGEANANLIAAAPDLLDAAIAEEAHDRHIDECLFCSSFGSWCEKGIQLWRDARARRRKAIAKAKGRPKKEVGK